MSEVEKLQQATKLHYAGELESAKRLYKQILQEYPDNPDVQHNLGLLYIQQGDPSTGLGLLQKVLQDHPAQQQYWFSYIDTLIELEEWQAATEALALASEHGVGGQSMDVLGAKIEQRSVVRTSPAPTSTPVQIEALVPAESPIDKLTSLYHSGQYATAESMAKSLIESRPDDIHVLNILGVVYAQQEKFIEAEHILLKVSELAPKDAEVYCNLGNVLQAQNMNEAAIANFLKAIELKPNFAEALSNLGNLFSKTGDDKEAMDDYRKAIEITMEGYRKAIAIKPDLEEAHYNLGVLFEKLEQYDEAVSCFKKAIQLNPKRSQLHYVLGLVFEKTGEYANARDAYIEASNLDPKSAKALNRLGLMYYALDEPTLALANVSNALTLNPDFGEALNTLGIIFESIGQVDMAIASHQKAIAISSDYSHPHNNLGNLLKDAGDLEGALASYSEAVRIDPGYYYAYSNILFCVNYHPDLSSAELYAYYQEYDEKFARPLSNEWKPHTNDRDPQRRLKIGYVSSSFWRHSSRFFLEPLLALHDHSQVEVYAYYQVRLLPDEVTARYESYVDHWIPTRGMSDEALTERIRADGIDILVDIAGHTGDNRLRVFARKPAPVSLHWLDFGYTTGLSAIDYYLTDAPTIPEGAEAYFSEKPWLLPTPAYAYRPEPGMGEVNELPALSKGHITFGTLTRAVRLNYKVIRTWIAILKAVPDSHLIINSNNFQSREMQERVAEQFVAQGIARERLEIGSNSPPWDILRQIDIGLDCFPHNSGTTLFEHLYMGSPFITLANRPSVGRLGASILTGAGHPEWIAENEDDYIAKAVALAQDLPSLAKTRSQLRTQLQQSPLMDEVGFTRAVEQAYRQMWQQWCADPK